MEVTQQQAYEAALMTIGRMTVEAHFSRTVIEGQAAEIGALKENADREG